MNFVTPQLVRTAQRFARNIAIATASVFCLLSLPEPSLAQMPPGLIGWWKGEHNANDSAGTNHGTLLNGVTFAPGAHERGSGFRLTPPAHVIIPYSASLACTEFSMQVWVNPTVLMTAGSQGLLFGQRFNKQIEVFPGTAGVYVAAFFRDTLGWHWVGTPDQIPLNQFTHVVTTWDGTTMKIYTNGVLSGQSQPGGTPQATPENLGIGGTDDGDNYFTGIVDDAAMWNRALTASEVEGLACNAPSIVRQPASTDATQGSTVTFSVQTIDMPPLSYQWQFNSNNIAGATGAAYTITNVQPTDTGFYTVMVSNRCGTVISDPARLLLRSIDVRLCATLTIAGPPGSNIRVDYTEDLTSTNWTTLTTITNLPFTPYPYICDWDSAGRPKRFYRSVFLP